jgi:hypothetical protein
MDYGISLFAGTPKTSGNAGDDGLAISANFAVIRGLWISSVDEVYMCDYGNSRIRKVTTTGIVVLIGGTISNPSSSSGGDGDAATSSALMKPWGISGDTNGNIFIAESTGHLVRKISSAGTISLVAGVSGTQTDIALANNPGTVDLGDGGSAEYGTFRTPSSVFAASNGDVLIADKNNCRVRIVSGISINTFAGEISQFLHSKKYFNLSQRYRWQRRGLLQHLWRRRTGHLRCDQEPRQRVARQPGQHVPVGGSGL